ncbi:MAG TPA: hypothetical protein VJ798_02140 [Rhizomicrobium sp.]|nr:hypothetical protein [Rhizomicrobium sp.]
MTLRNDGLASDAVAVTPSDTAENNCHGLYIGTGGDVAVKGIGGVAVTFRNVPAGTILPILVNRVMAANTTAANILGFVP